MSQPTGGTFAEKYGGEARRAVSFARNFTYSAADILVSSEDDLADIRTKTRNARDIIEAGGSLAVVLELIPADGSQPTGVPQAVEGMSTEEREMWTDFMDGLDLPVLDLMRDRAPRAANPSHQARDMRRLVSFRLLYDRPELTAENLAWFYKNHPYLIPLITAADKVQGAKLALSNGGKRDAREQAELIAANKIQAAAASRQAAILVEVNQHKSDIAYNLGAVQARRVAMQPEPEEGRKKAVVRYDEIRKAKGRTAVGAPKKWNREGAKGRVQALAEGLSQAGKRKSGYESSESVAAAGRKKARQGSDRPVAGPGPRTMAQAQGRSVAGSVAGRLARFQMRDSQEPPVRASPTYTPQSPRDDSDADMSDGGATPTGSAA